MAECKSLNFELTGGFFYVETAKINLAKSVVYIKIAEKAGCDS